LWQLVAIDVRMADGGDEAVVPFFLQGEIRNISQMIATGRQTTNSTMGACASNGVVVAKGQDLLRLYDEAASLVEGLSKKLGR
jgi:hypothetical protein